MKITDIFFVIAGTILALVCCDKPEGNDIPEIPVQGPQQILALSSVQNSILPAISWNDNDTVRVFHSPAGEGKYTSDGLFAFDGGGNKFSGNLHFIPEAEGLYDWRIIFPGSSEQTDMENIHVKIGAENIVQSSIGSAGHLDGEGFPLWGELKTCGADSESPLRLTLSPLYSIIELKVNNVTTGPVTMQSARMTSSGSSICGTFCADMTGEKIEFRPSEDCSGTIDIVLPSSETLRAGRTAAFYFAVCPFSAPAGSIEFEVNGIRHTCEDDMELAAGQIVSIEMSYDKEEEDPDALKGIFTVSASGKKVVFSKGNLWYGHEASNREFKIAEAQNKTLVAESDWDGAVFNGKYIQHFIWATTRTAAYDILAKDLTHETTDRLFAADGGAIEGWTVLTKDEWDYLLNKRTVNGGTGAGYAYFISGYKEVAGYKADGTTLKGVFIFPDDYTGTPAIIGNKALSWDEINSAGIAYLPAGGNYSKRGTAADNGWVSTSDFGGAYLGADIFVNDSSTNTFCTVKFNQNSETVTINTAPKAEYGYTIRLVREIN